MPANGSSSRMKRGCVASARAISTRLRSPPDSDSAGESRRWSTRRSCSRAVSRLSISARVERLALFVALQLEHGAHVFLDVELAEDRRLLRQVRQAQARAAMDRHVLDRAAVDGYLAGVGAHQAHDHVEGGRLAGAVGPEQAHHLALGHVERHVLDHLAAAIGLLQVPHLQPAGAGVGRRVATARHVFRHCLPPSRVTLGRSAAGGAAGAAAAGAEAGPRGDSTALTRPPGVVLAGPPSTAKVSLLLS